MWLCCQAGQDRAAAGDHGTLLTESSNLSAAGLGCLWKRVGVQMYKVSKLTDKRAANLRGCVAKWDVWVSSWGLEEVLYRRGQELGHMITTTTAVYFADQVDPYVSLGGPCWWLQFCLCELWQRVACVEVLLKSFLSVGLRGLRETQLLVGTGLLP